MIGRARAEGTVGTLPLVGALGLSLLGCEQPAPKCGVAPGSFAATYTLLEGSGDCATLPGEVLHIQPYYARRSARDPRPDYGKVSVGIQSASITELLFASEGRAEPNPEDQPYALGAFASSRPGEDDFCVVPTLSVARLRLPELPDDVVDACTTNPAQPAVDVSYEWSNLRVYTTAAAYGSQFSAELRYTRDGCSARYAVSAVYPAVSCAVPVEEPDAGELDAGEELEGGADLDASPGGDMDGGANLDAEASADSGLQAEPDASGTTDAGLGLDGGAELDAQADAADEDAECPPPEPPSADPVPDDSVCSQQPDPAHGIAVGSGINSEFAVHCDPTLLLCVLNKEPPSLR